MISRIQPSRNSSRNYCWPLAACLALGLALGGGISSAQTDSIGNAAEGSEISELPRLDPENVDLSAFEGIERGDSIGSSQTQGFGVVAESTGGPAAGGGVGGGGGGGFGGLGGLGGLFGGLGGAFGGQGGGAQKPIIRVRLRSAINLPPRPTADVQRAAQQTLSATSSQSGVQGVTVTMNGGTAVLTGTVGTEKDRRMSELLMRLEPGVRQVDNQVVVRDQ